MLQNKDSAEINSDVLHRLHLKPEEYVLVTCHRAENTDDKETLTAIVEGLVESGEKIVFPLHPRTEKMMRQFKIYSKLSRSKKIIVTEPLGYWDFQKLERNAKKIVTDSGGVVKEAYYFKKPCITMRQCSEWIETQQDGWNTCVNIISKTSLAKAIKTFRPTKPQTEVFGNGTASKVIVEILDEIFAKRGSR
jgi:UDP-N-acetylglucosamine 2-epimerase (non-hydrolysing)